MDLILGVGYWGEHTNVIVQTFCELSVRAGQSVCAEHKSKRHYVPIARCIW